MSNHEQLISCISERYGPLLDEIREFSDLHSIQIPKVVAVTKTRSIEEILAAWDVGIRDFGENYAQELSLKAKQLPMANWHFIGHLQRRNVKYIVPNTFLIHTVDSIKLAKRLQNVGYRKQVLIQVNISGEVSKSGVMFEGDKVTNLVEMIKEIGLDVIGLMGMGDPKWDTDEKIRTYQSLKTMSTKLSLDEVSMGMSGDWEEAIKSGSTIVRIGTAIFGSRTS